MPQQFENRRQVGLPICRIVVFLNIGTTAEVHDGRSPSGRIGFKAQEPQEFDRYHNIRIRPIVTGSATR